MEVCIDNIESAVNAENGGAIRIELCSSLREGGLTPSVGFLRLVKSKVSIPIFVMIRPRGGDFIYSDDEVEIMAQDIQVLKDNGADGFVFGLTMKNGTVDKENCSKLLKLTGGLPCTFHRAFDIVKYPFESLEEIIALGFNRILTSGLKQNAFHGRVVLGELRVASKGRLIILPGGEINRENVLDILKESGSEEFHGSAKVTKESRGYCVTDKEAVKEMMTIYHDYLNGKI